MEEHFGDGVPHRHAHLFSPQVGRQKFKQPWKSVVSAEVDAVIDNLPRSPHRRFRWAFLGKVWWLEPEGDAEARRHIMPAAGDLSRIIAVKTQSVEPWYRRDVKLKQHPAWICTGSNNTGRRYVNGKIQKANDDWRYSIDASGLRVLEAKRRLAV